LSATCSSELVSLLLFCVTNRTIIFAGTSHPSPSPTWSSAWLLATTRHTLCSPASWAASRARSGRWAWWCDINACILHACYDLRHLLGWLIFFDEVTFTLHASFMHSHLYLYGRSHKRLGQQTPTRCPRFAGCGAVCPGKSIKDCCCTNLARNLSKTWQTVLS